METYKYKCFGNDLTTGNVAYIIIGDQMSDVERQDFARLMNVPVCVFVDKLERSSANVSFYYPHKISPLCLHGSLATAKYIFSNNSSLHEFTLNSSFGKQITANLVNNKIWLNLNLEFIEDGENFRDEVFTILQINDKHINSNMVVASVGSPKLLVEVLSKDILFALSPELLALDSWNKQTIINGIYAYCLEDGNIFARNFNHLDERLEDGATGVAAAALCGYLQRDITVLQGYNIGNPCRLDVIYHVEQIALSGNVATL